MPDTRYSYTPDLTSPTTSHSLAMLQVTPGSTVLDIGAADGSVARPLAERGCRVWAIEVDASAAAKALSACERVIVGDVEVLDLDSALEGRRFDVVLLLDVIEHLREPLATVERARDLLAPGGRIIASIPNVAHGAVRVSLMSGTFVYTDTGLLDRTHLRFFDRRSAEALFTDAGLRIVERLRVRRGLTETEIPIDPSAVPPQIAQMLETDPEATTYQFVLAGVRSEGERVPEVVSLAELLQHRTEELEAQYRRLEGYARSLEERNRGQAEVVNRLTTQTATAAEELQRVRTELRSELETRLRELAQRHLELRHLRADLAVKEAFITELRSAADRACVETEAFTIELRRQDAVIQELRPAADRARVDQEASRVELQRRDAVIRELRLDVAARVDAQRRFVELQERLSATHEVLQRTRAFANSAGFRIVASVAGSLNRYPRVYGPLQRLVRRVARDLPRTLPRH